MAGVNIEFDREDVDRLTEMILQRVQEVMIGSESAAHIVPKLLSVKQVAEILQMPLSKVYTMLSDEQDPIPSLRLGEKSIRVDPRDFNRWLARHPNLPADHERLGGFLQGVGS